MINKNIETEYLKEQSGYEWHPLYRHVMNIVEGYGVECVRLGIKEQSENFRDMLELLKESYEGKNGPVLKENQDLKKEIDLFKPLIINQNGSLVLFKYDDVYEVQEQGYSYKDFFDIHNGLYRECRSVVIDIQKKKICIASQAKFKNLNEDDGDWSEESVRKRIAEAERVEFTDKLDGSNQNYRWYEGRIVGAGAQAIDPEKSWRLTAGYEIISGGHYTSMLWDNPDWTFLFEYISPQNANVVQYGDNVNGLFLFGMRNAYTGEEKSYEEVIATAKKYDVPSTVRFKTDLDEILGTLDDYEATEKEGWVLGIRDKSGKIFRVKIKVNDYVKIHSVLANMTSPNAIIRAIDGNTFDDLYSKIPRGYREAAFRTAQKIWRYVSDREVELSLWKQKFEAIVPADADWKAKAVWITEEVPKQYAGYMYQVMRDRPVNFLHSGNGAFIKMKDIDEYYNLRDK